MIMERLDIKGKTRIQSGCRSGKTARRLSTIGGDGPRSISATFEEENDYLKAQVEYLKKLNSNLHGELLGKYLSGTI